MSPLITTGLLAVLLAFPLAGRSRGLPAMLALAAVAWVIASVLGVVGTDTLVSLLTSRQDPALHDTYYVVSHVQYQLTVAALLGGLALLAWLARARSRLATLSFWVAHIALIASVFGHDIALRWITAPPARTYLEQAERLETVNTATTATTGIALFALATLAVLILVGLIRRIRARD